MELMQRGIRCELRTLMSSTEQLIDDDLTSLTGSIDNGSECLIDQQGNLMDLGSHKER